MQEFIAELRKTLADVRNDVLVQVVKNAHLEEENKDLQESLDITQGQFKAAAEERDRYKRLLDKR